MRLDSISAKAARARSAIARMQSENSRLAVQLDSLANPDRIVKIAEVDGMKPISPSLSVSCLPPARMAKAVDTISPKGWPLR